MKSMRHGDVQLVPINAIPQDATHKDGLVLAYGEVTGHKHEIDVGDLFETRDGKLYLKVDKPATLFHEEHKKSPVPPGLYFVGIKRQYSAESGWSRVKD